MRGLLRVDGVLVVSGAAARTLCEAVLIAERARRSAGLPLSRDYETLAQELYATMSASGQSDIAADAACDPEVVGPTVPIEQAAAELGCSKRQARRIAPELGGRIVGGRWLIDRHALNEHLEGRDSRGSDKSAG